MRWRGIEDHQPIESFVDIIILIQILFNKGRINNIQNLILILTVAKTSCLLMIVSEANWEKVEVGVGWCWEM